MCTLLLRAQEKSSLFVKASKRLMEHDDRSATELLSKYLFGLPNGRVTLRDKLL